MTASDIPPRPATDDPIRNAPATEVNTIPVPAYPIVGVEASCAECDALIGTDDDPLFADHLCWACADHHITEASFVFEVQGDGS